MPVIVGVALGGALGASARYGRPRDRSAQRLGLSVGDVRDQPERACFLIGLISATLIDRHHLPAWVRVGLVLGVIGGYTTFDVRPGGARPRRRARRRRGRRLYRRQRPARDRRRLPGAHSPPSAIPSTTIRTRLSPSASTSSPPCTSASSPKASPVPSCAPTPPTSSPWFNGGDRTTTGFHNQIGLLAEIIGGPTPQSIPDDRYQTPGRSRSARAHRPPSGVASAPEHRLSGKCRSRHSRHRLQIPRRLSSSGSIAPERIPSSAAARIPGR